MSNENKNLKALKCENCGGDIAKSYRVIDEDESIPVAKCLSCGTEYDPSSEEYYLYFADEFNENSSNSIFKLGMKGKIEGVEYEIIGRLRYKEQDPDDYEEGIWDEWFTVSSDGGFHYFVEEDGKVLSYNEYIPNSIDMDSDSSYIYFDGKAISKNSAYIGRVILAEGELPWEPDIGEPVKCYDIKNNGEKFSIEQSEDEITICKSTKIPYKDIIDGFDLDEHRENYNETMTQRKKFLLKSKIYLVAMFISLGLLFTTCSTGSKVKGVMNKQIVITDNELKVENGKPSYHSNVLYGPFRLENKEGLYNITIGINERIKRLNSEWQSFGFMIIKEENLKRIKDNLENKLELKKFFNQIDLKKEPIESFSIAMIW